MESISVSGEVGGAGGAYSYKALKSLDQIWSNICSAQTVLQETQKIVLSNAGLFSQSDLSDKEVDEFDVIVCGGTLGIFIAIALSFKDLRVAIVERNILKGNRKFWVEDVLNLGVSPAKLIEIVKKRFISLGGVIFEGYSVSSICTYEDAAVLQLVVGKILSSHLIIDAMGNFSLVVKQIRRGRKPDGMCLVVGSCAHGFKEKSTSDVIYSSSSVKKVGDPEVQLFWEAFPTGSGLLDRTTYMFTYIDPQPGSPKLKELLEHYWDLMPEFRN